MDRPSHYGEARRAESLVIRLMRAIVMHAAVSAGYWIRPYDSLLDRRRWRWGRRGRCGRIIWAELSEEGKQALVDGARRAVAKREQTEREIDRHRMNG